jgi:hypothetical protein
VLAIVALLTAHTGRITQPLADPAVLKAFRRLQRTPMTENELQFVQEEVRGASDRAMALIYAGVLDNVIEECLKRRMVTLSSDEYERLFRGPGPLSSLSAKINIAYAFRIFGKRTKRDLHFIREIRNAFAHAPRALLFSTKQLSDLCAALYYPDNILNALPNPNPTIKEPFSFLRPTADLSNNPRLRYEITCQTVSFNLNSFDIHNFNYTHRQRYLP